VVKALASLLAVGLLVVLSACASPRAPSVTAPTGDPPSDLRGGWTGSGTDPQGPVVFRWSLTQTGTTLNGVVMMDPVDPSDGSCGSCHKQKAGTVSGTINGTALTLTLDFPEGGADVTPLCGLRLTATANDVTPRRIAASYTGTTTCEGPIAGGALVMTR
jgi:hypothetical protein